MIANSSSNEEIVVKEKISKRLRKTVLNVLKCNELDVRDVVISSDGQYIISCSEVLHDQKPRIYIWRMAKVVEGEIEPELILEGDLKTNDKIPISNWFLCVDTIIGKTNDSETWMICAGSIIGDIYVWYGKIDQITEEWNMKEIESQIFSEGDIDQPKAIFDIKIRKDPIESSSYHVYYTLNNIQAIRKIKTKDNLLKELPISLDNSGKVSINKPSKTLGTQDEWITILELYHDKENNTKDFLLSGSRDGMVYKWSLGSESIVDPIIIGKHKDSVTCVKVSSDGKTIASSSFDNTIRIWNNNNSTNPELITELEGHNKAVVAIDYQINNRFLVSISRDNTVKIWDLDRGIWKRSIDMNYHMNEKAGEDSGRIRGMTFLKCLKISPDNRYIITSIHNRIFVLRNFGEVWHFAEQLKFIKDKDEYLYSKIYGINLRQIAKKSPETIESLSKIYDIIKKRMKKATQIEMSLISQELQDDLNEYSSRELGALFIPTFLKFEQEIKFQNEFILGIKDNYKAYWHSLKNLIFKKPDLPWKFKLYITTDAEEDIKDAKFIEVTNQKDISHIIMKDRSQTLIRFLLVLEDVQPGFIPLLESINIDVEDDRGDKDTLIFSNFINSNNFIKILTEPQKSVKKFSKLKEPSSLFYSTCTFQLEEGYNTEKEANVFIRRITPEYTEKLNPLEISHSKEEDIKIFGAFKDNFQYPLIPKIQIQVGKGFASNVGKIIDDYFGKIIIIEFMFSLWGFLEVGLPAILPDVEGLDIISNIVSITGVFLILGIFIIMLLKKKE